MTEKRLPSKPTAGNGRTVFIPNRLGYDPGMDGERDMAAGETAGRATVGTQEDGWRLDRVTALLWPELGLRGRRRRIAAGGATVNGRRRGPAHKVRAGDVIAVAPLAGPTAFFSPADIPILAAGPDYAALVKPGGLFSASLGPTGGHSLEDLLPALFPDRPALLLSRLDDLTSGLVPVAFSSEAAAAYRRLEDAGQVAKTYLAVVHGRVGAPFATARELDVADRATTRVLAREAADPLRRTAVAPVRMLAGLTLIRCRIAKGARHQIRAHLAAAGYPIVGDPRYGRGEGDRLFLHCAALDCPALAVACPPPWSLEDAAAAAEKG